MTRRLVGFAVLAGVVAAGVAEALSQPNPSAVHPVVNEAAARAILGTDTIQVRLPLTALKPGHSTWVAPNCSLIHSLRNSCRY